MDKNKIINYLNDKFLKEEATPGIDLTNQVKKESDKINKEALKTIEKDVASYDKEIKKNVGKAKMPANKFNYNGDKEKEYHDQMEIMNGQEMIQYDREPNQDFKDRAKEAIVGSSRMGNKAGEGTANVEPTWGASSADFGKNLVKRAGDSAKKRQDAEYKIISFGDDIETVPKGSKPMSKFSAFVKEGVESKSVLGKALKVGDILSANSKKIKSIDTTTAGRVIVTTTDNDRLDFDAQKEYGVNLVTPETTVSEGEDEIASKNIADNNPYGSEKEKTFYDKENQGDSKYNLTPIRNHANDYNGYTHFAIHKLSNAIVMPFDYSDMMPKKPVPTANTTPRAKAIYKQKLDEYKQEMKRVQAELNQFKKDYFIDEIRDEIDYLLDAPFKASDYAIVTKDGLAKYGIDLNNFMLFKGDINSTPEADIQENKNNTKPQIKEGMKRLNFKKEFNGVGNALKMIPESYRVDNKVFEMTDGNESYKIRWEGTLTEGKAVVLTASNKTMVNEDMQKMKHLMGYKSQDTLGTVKGKARINENVVFGDIFNKTKALLEGEDIEDQNAPEKDADKVVSQAKEAKKDVEGSVSSEKGTQAPAPKTGSMESLDDAKSQAKEAKEHVEGSVESKLGLGLGVKTKEGHWDAISVPQAADAKKHVTMNEGVTLGGIYYGPIVTKKKNNVVNENWMDESLDSDGIYQGQSATSSLSNSKGITSEFDKIEDQIKNSGDSELLRLYGEYTKSYKENQAKMDNDPQYNSNMGFGSMDPRTGNTIRLMAKMNTIAKSKGISAAPVAEPVAEPQKTSFMQRAKQKLGFNENEKGVSLGESYFAPMDENMYEEMMGYGNKGARGKEDEFGNSRVSDEDLKNQPLYTEEEHDKTMDEILADIVSAMDTEDDVESKRIMMGVYNDLKTKVKTNVKSGMQKTGDYLRKKLGEPMEEGMYEGEGLYEYDDDRNDGYYSNEESAADADAYAYDTDNQDGESISKKQRDKLMDALNRLNALAIRTNIEIKPLNDDSVEFKIADKIYLLRQNNVGNIHMMSVDENGSMKGSKDFNSYGDFIKFLIDYKLLK